jgi:exoribonuclease-2
VRDNLVRLDAVPLYLRVADLPALPPQTRVRVGLDRIELLAATLETRYLGPATD